jgi:hypothetical protein
MRTRIGAAVLAAAFAASGAAWADDDDERRGKGFRRAEKHCEKEAEDRGLRVEKVGEAEKVAKKRYEVKLRVEDDRWDARRDRRDDDDFRVLCLYDDEERRARID